MKSKTLAIAAMCLGLYFGINESADAQNPRAPRGELYGQRASLFEQLGTTSEDIIFLGNSLTHGAEWHELFNNPNVKNRGINGDTVDGISERLESVTAGEPKKIFLLCGVNDVSHNLTADQISAKLIALVEKIKEQSPNTRIYVESLLPINNNFNRYKLLAGKEQVIKDINKTLALRMPEMGVEYIDVTDLFTDKNGNLREDFTNDGLHLLGPAYIVWRDYLQPFVEE